MYLYECRHSLCDSRLRDHKLQLNTSIDQLIIKLRFSAPNKICDGHFDCNDGLDEMGCDCPAGFFKCSTLNDLSDRLDQGVLILVIDGLIYCSSTCINSSSLCNGASDCPGGVDEIQCIAIDMEGSDNVHDSFSSPPLNPINQLTSSNHLRLLPISTKTGYLKVSYLQRLTKCKAYCDRDF